MKIVFCFFFFYLAAQAKVLTIQEKLADFTQINLAIDSSYGPLEHKQKVEKIDVYGLREKYQKRISATTTNADFYFTMVQYISEFRDGHFGAVLPSDYTAEIPILTDLVQGKVLIGDIDREKLPKKQFPFQRGDEILSVNGQSSLDLVKVLQKSLGGGFDLADRRTAAQALFIRSARRFPVPEGSVEIEIKKAAELQSQKIKLNWQISGEPFDEHLKMLQFSRPARFHKTLSVRNHLTDILGSARMKKSYQCSGSTRIKIPADATVIMKSPFVAYYHPTPKGPVGYLRIPHYSWDNPSFTFKKYEYAVQILEEKTVGLIIDQDHNCGGEVDFLHALATLFIQRPIAPIQFQLLASKTEYFDFKNWLADFEPQTLAYHNIEKVLKIIKKAWDQGSFLTERTSIDGRQWIYPNPIHYTKPIVMLIDELSASGGDAFPALLGGNGQAILLGTRTWGLGGHIQDLPPLNHSGLQIRMTKSLFFRPDGEPVEGQGVLPHIPYEISREDFMNGYLGYQRFYLKALFGQLEKSTPAQSF